jgi:hypothetical protein
VAALLNKMGRRRVTVGMDGSLYKFHPHFHDRMVTKVSLTFNVKKTRNVSWVSIVYLNDYVTLSGQIKVE